MSDDGTVGALAGQLLSLRYVTLDQALAWRWGENPKRHDLDQLAASFQRSPVHLAGRCFARGSWTGCHCWRSCWQMDGSCHCW